MERARPYLAACVLGCPDPRELAAFYAELLGWTVVEDQQDWVRLQPSGGGPGLSFQFEDDYTRPMWPEQPTRQQMMMHLDIAVDDLVAETIRAQELGAVGVDFQPQDHVRVMVDPAGHPFCLFVR